MVGVGLEDGVEVDAGDAQLGQVGQLLADALKVAAEVVPVQVAVLLLVGPEIGLAVLVFPVDAVGKGPWACPDPSQKAVGEDLVHARRRRASPALEVRLVDGQLPRRPASRDSSPSPSRAAEELAEIGVQVKVVEVQPGGGRASPHRKMVDAVGLALELHAVVDRVVAVLGQHQLGLHIAQFSGVVSGTPPVRPPARRRRAACTPVGLLKKMVPSGSLLAYLSKGRRHVGARGQKRRPLRAQRPCCEMPGGTRAYFTGLVRQMLRA